MAVYDNFMLPHGIPVGTPYNKLTKEQKAKWRAAYRFSGYRPSDYQGITGRF